VIKGIAYDYKNADELENFLMLGKGKTAEVYKYGTDKVCTGPDSQTGASCWDNTLIVKSFCNQIISLIYPPYVPLHRSNPSVRRWPYDTAQSIQIHLHLNYSGTSSYSLQGRQER